MTGGPTRAVSGRVRLHRGMPVATFSAVTLWPAARKTAGCGTGSAGVEATQPAESAAGGGLPGKTGADQPALPSESRSAITALGPALGRPGAAAGGARATKRSPISGYAAAVARLSNPAGSGAAQRSAPVAAFTATTPA